MFVLPVCLAWREDAGVARTLPSMANGMVLICFGPVFFGMIFDSRPFLSDPEAFGFPEDA